MADDIIQQRLNFITGTKSPPESSKSASAKASKSGSSSSVAPHPVHDGLVVTQTQPSAVAGNRGAPAIQVTRQPPRRVTGIAACWRDCRALVDGNRGLCGTVALILVLVVPGAALITTSDGLSQTIGVLLLGAFVVVLLYALVSCVLQGLGQDADAEHHPCFQATSANRLLTLCRCGCCHRRRTVPLPHGKLKTEQDFQT